MYPFQAMSLSRLLSPQYKRTIKNTVDTKGIVIPFYTLSEAIEFFVASHVFSRRFSIIFTGYFISYC